MGFVDTRRQGAADQRSGEAEADSRNSLRDNSGILRHCTVDNGIYKVVALNLEHVENEKNGRSETKHYLHIMLEDRLGEVHTIIEVVTPLFKHLLKCTDRAIGSEVTIEDGGLQGDLNATLEKIPWEDENAASPGCSEAVLWQNHILCAMGLANLTRISSKKAYKVEGIEVDYNDSGVDWGMMKTSLIVNLAELGSSPYDITKLDRIQEGRSPKTRLILQYNPADIIDYERRRRAMRFFECMAGRCLTPKIDLPSIIDMEDSDVVISAIAANVEPKLKAGELYMLDGVKRKGMNGLIITVHKAVQAGGAPAQESPLINPSENGQIELFVEVYADVTAKLYPKLENKTQSKVYGFLQHMLSASACAGRVVVLSPTCDVHEGTLSYMCAPAKANGPIPTKPLYFGEVNPGDTADLENERMRVSRLIRA